MHVQCLVNFQDICDFFKINLQDKFQNKFQDEISR